jgi:hypothetical protein
VVGPDRDNHRAALTITYQTLSQAPSTFDIEIDDGQRTHRKVGPGSFRLVLLGNTATQIRVRCKSHTLGQNVVVRA